MTQKFNFITPASVLAVLVPAFLLVALCTHTPVQAADNNVSNGITVDSTRDTPDDNVGDNVCDDGDGNCTLRAAIQEANSNADATTINFNITGTADFINEGQDGYTIAPTAALPVITETLTIDGYSQPGAQANTAVAPNPLNGLLLIEIDGSVAGDVHGFILTSGAGNSSVKGLVVNGFSSGDAFSIYTQGVIIQGNYIGTNVRGSAAKPNNVGVNSTDGTVVGENALIGGLNPADRNIISGNTGEVGSITATGGYPGSGWIIRGNYVGVAANGISPIPNSVVGNAGAFSIDNASGVEIGGPQIGAINVISGNYAFGLAPQFVSNLIIQGNYIGVGYDATTPVPNGDQGIGLADASDVLIGGSDAGEGNIISHNTKLGINIGNIVAGTNTNIRIEGNKIQNNGVGGILINSQSSDIIIGSTNPSGANDISFNHGPGVNIGSLRAPAFSLSGTPEDIAILGNSIHSNVPISVSDPTSPWADTGIGIDLFDIEFDGSFNPTSSELGPTQNDLSDFDIGPSNYINFPELKTATQSGNQATITYSLDAADSPTGQYRVEFFSNDEVDPSGYGEGQTFLGAITTTNGINKQASITLPTGTNLTGRSISATTTALDSTTSSGFGSTSEFSQLRVATVTGVTGPSLAMTGQSQTLLWFIITLLLTTSIGLILVMNLVTDKTV